MLSPAEIAEIERELAVVPKKQAACIEALRVVQRHRGWVSDEAIADLALFLELSPAELDGVATFYNLIFRQPVGRHVVRLCTSVSCWILRCPELHHALADTLSIDFGQTTSDRRFTLLPIQCLGTCDHAPALMVDEDLYQDVTIGALPEILARYE